MVGCVENNHDHEGPWVPCVRGTATPTTSHSVTGEPARHRHTPIKFENPLFEQTLSAPHRRGRALSGAYGELNIGLSGHGEQLWQGEVHHVEQGEGLLTCAPPPVPSLGLLIGGGLHIDSRGQFLRG